MVDAQRAARVMEVVVRQLSVSKSVVIGLDSATIYEHISDPVQTRRWSPENTGAQTINVQGSLPVGATFVGRNRRHGFQWCTECKVFAAEPGRRFAFRAERIGLRRPRLKARIASWEYVLEPIDGGTRVTETWTDNRTNWPDFATTCFDRVVTRKKSFADFNAVNIQTTLRNLKSTLEAEHGG